MAKRDRIDWLLTAINAVQDLVQPKLAARRGLQASASGRERDSELEICLEELRVAAEELQELRDRLALERQRYVELFDFAPEAYLETDAHGNVREANRAAAALLRCGQDELMGKPLPAFIAAQSRKDLRGQMAALGARDHPVVEFETQVQPRDEPPLPVRVRASASHDAAGRVRGIRWLIWPCEQNRAATVHADGTGESG